MRAPRSLPVILLLGMWLACDGGDKPHDHSEAHPEGHDHHAHGHGHSDGPVEVITRWSESFELFAEHPLAVKEHKTPWLVHLTRLEDFSPVMQGRVELVLEGPTTLKASASIVLRPGIYKLVLPPGPPGEYTGSLRVDGKTAQGSIEGLRMRVFASEEEAEAAAGGEAGDAGRIEFLKEQQWKVPFATAFAERGALIASVEVPGRVDTPPGGVAEVSAPVTGRVVAPAQGLPRPGDSVRKGQLLVSLQPAPSSPEDAARAALAVAEANARTEAAQAALTRAQRLIEDEAIPRRDLEDAQREARVAEEAVAAAKRAAALYAGLKGGGRGGSWLMKSPIDGVVDVVHATPGESVGPGHTLFRVVDPSELWLVANVPEQDAARLRTEGDPSYRVAGLREWKQLALGGETPDASLVSVSRTVDPKTRTVEVRYALSDPDPSLRVGGLIELSLPAGERFEGIVIDRTALIDDEGRKLVYVQDDGEHFVERAVRVGPAAGSRIAITTGLGEGERIVTRGAQLIRLADRANSGEAHGHIH